MAKRKGWERTGEQMAALPGARARSRPRRRSRARCRCRRCPRRQRRHRSRQALPAYRPCPLTMGQSSLVQDRGFTLQWGSATVSRRVSRGQSRAEALRSRSRRCCSGHSSSSLSRRSCPSRRLSLCRSGCVPTCLRRSASTRCASTHGSHTASCWHAGPAVPPAVHVRYGVRSRHQNLQSSFDAGLHVLLRCPAGCMRRPADRFGWAYSSRSAGPVPSRCRHCPQRHQQLRAALLHRVLVVRIYGCHPVTSRPSQVPSAASNLS